MSSSRLPPPQPSPSAPSTSNRNLTPSPHHQQQQPHVPLLKSLNDTLQLLDQLQRLAVDGLLTKVERSCQTDSTALAMEEITQDTHDVKRTLSHLERMLNDPSTNLKYALEELPLHEATTSQQMARQLQQEIESTREGRERAEATLSRMAAQRKSAQTEYGRRYRQVFKQQEEEEDMSGREDNRRPSQAQAPEQR